MWTWIKGLFTDSKDRPEIKAVTGFASIVIAFVRLFQGAGYQEFLAVAGFGLACLGLGTAENIKQDKGA